MRLIDGDDLIEVLVKEKGFYPAMVASAIKNAPTIDPVKHGEWKVVPVYGTLRWECSICGATVSNQTKYCTHCGARNETVVV